MSTIPLHALTAVLSLLAACAAIGGGPGRRLRLAAVLPLLLTALWAVLAAAGSLVPDWAPRLADLLRTASAVALLLLLLGVSAPRHEGGGRSGPLAVGLMVALLMGLADFAIDAVRGHDGVALVDLGLISRIGFDVLGLLLVENLFRHASPGHRWAVKHLLVGFGALFAYDLYAMADALLYRSLERPGIDHRALVAALVMPLVAVSLRRLPGLAADIAVSRAVVLHTTALVGAGLYLLAVAVVGFAVGASGSAWAEVVHFALLFGAVLVLAVLLLSQEAKAKARHWASRHFFPLAYDYRREWLRFIDTMARDSADSSLYRRAVRAVADVFDCAGGALFLCQRGDVFVQLAREGWTAAGSLLALPAPLVARLRQEQSPLDLLATGAETATLRQLLGGLDQPWLALPLPGADGALLGVILLGHPRARRPLGWEERELLQVLAVQVASYIREDQAARALAVAQRFERTGRRFTFVAHDIKTTVSQLGLVVQQAARHGQNPEFMVDAMETVRHSVDRMRALLVRLRDSTEADPTTEIVDLELLARDVARRKAAAARAIDVTVEGTVPPVVVDPLAATMVLENLIQNAVEAAEGHVSIALILRGDTRAAVLEVADDGPGMTRSFIETRLFAPFATTKESGFGIGMYQCRCLAEDWGGDLAVDSSPGAGTRVRLRFPAALSADAQDALSR